ncbi:MULTISPECIES: energy transducer TonB [unclassified Dysgonomonas]|uniref:energy transducer TonB n=1 Tax=unclassified Dysgonomonas TaxID=2630389 RepID=UPI0013EB3683|nr:MULTISPECIES: energy transducer TonB [unclassified Dysgonomonas]
MKNSINLNSSEWCDIVFEGKNKSYGAYAMRQTSTKRHIIAFGITLLIVAFVAFLPSLISSVKAATATPGEGVKDTYTLIEVDTKAPVDPVIPDMAIPEPPKELATMKVTPPVIVEDNLVTDENSLKSMEEITKSKGVIAAFDNEGDLVDRNAVAKLEEASRRAITEKPEVNTGGPIDFAEIMPQFPGGANEMYKYINQTLKYPVIAQETNTQGKVIIRFVVGKNGEISDVTVLRGFDPSCDKEAVRVVKSMPRWIAGKQNGNPVQVYFTLPITFQLRN